MDPEMGVGWWMDGYKVRNDRRTRMEKEASGEGGDGNRQDVMSHFGSTGTQEASCSVVLQPDMRSKM